jgi:hypothetical protein
MSVKQFMWAVNKYGSNAEGSGLVFIGLPPITERGIAEIYARYIGQFARIKK